MEVTYKYERLNDDISVCVSKAHTFGTDAFLLAAFAQVRRKDTVCDLGTGCGIIPLVMARDWKPKKITAVEIQPQAVEQLKLGLAHSRIESEITPVCSDLKELGFLEAGSFDVITCNPPYKANSAGILSGGSADQIARHEVMCNLDDICRAASRLLRFGGRFCICQRPERLADAICSMREHGMEPKRLRMVSKRLGDEPWLFLLEGRRGSKPFLRVMPALAVYDGDELSKEMRDIHGYQPPASESGVGKQE